MARKNEAERKALQKQYRKLAKRADQRLKRLEDLSEQEGFGNVKKWAYNRAMKDIEQYSGKGARRFNRDIPSDIKMLRARITDVEHFLFGTKTSTKKDIMKMYKKRVKTTASRYGAEISWEKAADFYESKTWKDLDREYGSQTAITAIGYIQQNGDKIQKAIEQHKPVTLRIKDEKVSEAVNNILEEQGLSILNMI